MSKLYGGEHYLAVTSLPWHVSYREWDNHHSICTDKGHCVAVRPALCTREEWEPIANDLVIEHNASLGQMNAAWVLGQILHDLPERRDWLNPDLEKNAKAIVAQWKKVVKENLSVKDILTKFAYPV